MKVESRLGTKPRNRAKGTFGWLCGVVIIICLFSIKSRADDTKHLVILESMQVPIVAQFTDSFLTKINEYGSRNNLALQITRLNADGDRELARRLAVEAIASNPDIVISVATIAAQVVQRETESTQIPHLFMCVTDPVGAGLVKEIGVPSHSNITGKVHYINAQTKIEMVNRVIRKTYTNNPVHFGFIYTDYPADVSDFKRLLDITRNRTDIEFVPYKITYQKLPEHQVELLSELASAVDQLNEMVDYFWAPRGALAVHPGHDQILLEQATKPFLVGATQKSVELGALMHITADPASQGAEAATMAYEILQGKDPGTIPVSLPEGIQFAVNLKAAEKLQLVIPSDLLRLAGDNVYR
ncbi:MAG: hypothetical protein D6B25_10285 [Desulfobulbaceae bacterium]|nr:MAG: hypothetical protein D6B25_10285 [Desulfobulbaceae bacterium]